MTGSEQGGALIGMGGAAFVFIGIVLLIIGGIAAITWSFQWWLFLPGAIFFVLGGIGIGLLFHRDSRRTN
jgi:hypothetical protein